MAMTSILNSKSSIMGLLMWAKTIPLLSNIELVHVCRIISNMNYTKKLSECET